jgi:hypothetical protein
VPSDAAADARHRCARAVVLLAALLLTAAVAAPASAAPTVVPSSMLPPTVRETVVLGSSVLGRPIIAYRVGDPDAGTTAVLLGQMHGDEPAGVVLAQAVLAGRPLAGVDLWVVPTMNPDGAAARRRQNARGVDLNRNWPSDWRRLRGQYDSGPAPLSEPETRALQAFLARVRPDRLVSVHQPLVGVDTTDGGARDPAFARELAAGLGLPLKAFRCWSACRGSMTGWLTRTQAGAAVTVELPATPPRSWLRGRAPAVVIGALGAVADTPARHQPVLDVGAMALPDGSVRLEGWAYDPDAPQTPLVVTVLEGATTVASARADQQPSDVALLDPLLRQRGFVMSVAAAPGAHVFCVVAANVVFGDRPARRCLRVTVP